MTRLALLIAGFISLRWSTVLAQNASELTTLYTFTGGTAGAEPQARLLQGSDGNFYGTTLAGGTESSGTVFMLTPVGALTVLYNFVGGNDGADPTSGLIQGSNGEFYGTTSGDIEPGGFDPDFNTVPSFGSVYEITPAGVITTLHNFTYSSDGGNPSASLIQGSDGNFYGTTGESGTIFQITPAGVLTTLYTFTGGDDGDFPYASLIQGSDGNFYGTTGYGGVGGYGTIYEITPSGVLTTLYSFTGGSDGAYPSASLIQGSDGNFYGTTEGDDSNTGTIFKLTVAAAPSSFFAGELPLGENVYYLSFPAGSYFGYYAFLSDPAYIYHFDLVLQQGSVCG